MQRSNQDFQKVAGKLIRQLSRFNIGRKQNHGAPLLVPLTPLQIQSIEVYRFIFSVSDVDWCVYLL